MWYDKFALIYDWFLEDLYRDTRSIAVSNLRLSPGQTALDIPCGTGLSHEFMQNQIGSSGKLIAVDRSSGMLRKSELRAKRFGWTNVVHLEIDAGLLSKSEFERNTDLTGVDGIFCGLGLTAIDNWELVFNDLFDLLNPGGRFVIYDVHAEKKTPHRFAVELVARADLSRECWKPLECVTDDFNREILSDDISKFGGNLYVAHGTKTDRTLR